MALRKREEKNNPAFKVIILDDILTSVDAPHRYRVAEFLLKEFSENHQIIITTHNRLWFEWIVQLQNRQGIRQNFINKQILDWSLGRGPQIIDMEGDFAYLMCNKNKLHHEYTAPIAGRLFESILQELRYSLKLAVEAKRDEKYTIGDLWPKFMSSVRKHIKYLWAEIEPLCNTLNDSKVIRNWETHSTEWAKELSRDEAMLFIETVMNLYEKVYCTDCSCFIAHFLCSYFR